MTFEQALLGAIVALSAAIGVVYADLNKRYTKMYEELSKRLNDCESDRRELWKTIATQGISISENTQFIKKGQV